MNIYTHSDFDGIVSVALALYFFKEVDKISFANPGDISNSRKVINENDAVFDLPYPVNCGWWFDHHKGNLEQVLLRKIDPDTIRGRFREEKSCSRVVYDFLKENNIILPDFIEKTVIEADKIDSFGYKDICDWQKITPSKIIDSSIKSRQLKSFDKDEFLRYLIGKIKTSSIEEVSKDNRVVNFAMDHFVEEKKMSEIIKKNIKFFDIDIEKKLIVIDFCNLKKPPFVAKNLAFIFHPGSRFVLLMQNIYENQIKLNKISLNISASLFEASDPTKIDLGAIMRDLNIGDGHAGAASGIINSMTKSELEKEKQKALRYITEKIIFNRI